VLHSSWNSWNYLCSYKYDCLLEAEYEKQFINLILFVPCIVIAIIQIHQHTHIIYTKSRIIYIHYPLYMFQQQLIILRETLIQRNIKLIHQIYINNVKINGSNKSTQHSPTQDTSLHGTATSFVTSKTLKPDICMHKSTYNINSSK